MIRHQNQRRLLRKNFQGLSDDFVHGLVGLLDGIAHVFVGRTIMMMVFKIPEKPKNVGNSVRKLKDPDKNIPVILGELTQNNALSVLKCPIRIVKKSCGGEPVLIKSPGVIVPSYRLKKDRIGKPAGRSTQEAPLCQKAAFGGSKLMGVR